MKNLMMAVAFAIVAQFAVGSVYANCGSCGHGDKKLTKEERAKKVAMHEAMAKCLKDGKDMSECHKIMHKHGGCEKCGHGGKCESCKAGKCEGGKCENCKGGKCEGCEHCKGKKGKGATCEKCAHGDHSDGHDHGHDHGKKAEKKK